MTQDVVSKRTISIGDPVSPPNRMQEVVDLVAESETGVSALVQKLLKVVDWEHLSLIPKDTQQMLQEVIQVRPKTQMGMSRFQIQRLLLNPVEYPTATSMYWQCARELAVRLNEMVRQDFAYKRAILELEEKEEALRQHGEVATRARRRAELDLEEHTFNVVNMQLQIAETVREAHAFYEVMHDIQEHGDPQTQEELKDWELGELRKWFAKGIVNERGVRMPQFAPPDPVLTALTQLGQAVASLDAHLSERDAHLSERDAHLSERDASGGGSSKSTAPASTSSEQQ
jgi:hypothetical protein